MIADPRSTIVERHAEHVGENFRLLYAGPVVALVEVLDLEPQHRPNVLRVCLNGQDTVDHRLLPNDVHLPWDGPLTAERIAHLAKQAQAFEASFIGVG